MRARLALLCAALVACSGNEAVTDAPGGAAGETGSGSGGASGSGGSGVGGSVPAAGAATGGSSGGSSGGTSNGGSSGGASNGGTSGGGSSGSPSRSGAAGDGSAGANQAGASGGSTPTAGGGSGGGAGQSGGLPVEEALAPLPSVRQEHAVVALAGEIYVIGGYVANAVSASVVAYDPVGDGWRDVEDFPVPLQHPHAGVVGDKLYVAGFYETPGTTDTSAQTFEYDPVAEAWTPKASLPMDTARAAGCATVDAGLFYVFGGAFDGTSVTHAARYDPGLDEWETLPPLPEAREHCGAGAIDGTLYVAGGRVDEIVNIEADLWALDPVARTWTPRQSMLEPRGGFASAVLDGRLFTFGGEGNPDGANGIFNNVEAYDPVADAWETLPPMVVPRHGFGAATLDGRIYLPGGATRQGGAPSAEHSVFFLE